MERNSRGRVGDARTSKGKLGVSVSFRIIKPYMLFPMHVIVIDDDERAEYHVYNHRGGLVGSGWSKLASREERLRGCIEYASRRGRAELIMSTPLFCDDQGGKK